METTEKFNIKKAEQLIDHADYYKTMLNYNKEQYDPFNILTRYVNESNYGKVKVTYNQKSGGRWFANHGLSLQNMPCEIRGCISREYYYDIDMVNAHPTILEEICLKNDIVADKLSDYINNRETLISELINLNPSQNRASVKKGVLSILNGGSAWYKSIFKNDWIRSFYKEIKNITDELCNNNNVCHCLYELAIKDEHENPKGCAINKFICQIENNLLQIMIEYFKKNKLIENDYVMVFDGLMIPKNKKLNDKFLQMHLRLIEDEFKKAGYNVLLKVKEMEDINLDVIKNLVDDIEDEKNDKDNQDPEEEIMNQFDFSNPNTYQLFYNKYNGHVFKSEAEMRYTMIKEYPHVIAHVLQGDGVYIRKMHDSLDIVKKNSKSDFNMYYVSEKNTTRGKKKNTTIKASFLQFLGTRPAFESVECSLLEIKNKRRSFNTWSGFQAKLVDLNNLNADVQTGLDILKQFIFEIWSMGDEHYNKYILSWFAGLVKNLNGINRVALVMISREGTGKNTLTDFMELILNKKNMASVTGIGSIVQKHNTLIQNKRLVLVNEMSSTMDEFRCNFDKIKGLITDQTLTIEPKGINPYEINNISNLILFTNHRDSVIVSESDRRYAIFEMAETHMNDVPYFTELRAKCFNQDVADAFYTYLIEYECIPLGTIPKTNIRNEIQNFGKASPLKFIDYLVEEKLVEDGNEIQAKILYDQFKKWCNDNGERLCSNTKFGSSIGGIWKKRKSGVILYKVKI